MNINLPELKIQATGYWNNVNDNFGISLNLKQIAPAQIRNFSFNSMCMFNGVPIAASSDGIFTLDTAETDDELLIDSIVELVNTNFNHLGLKRFRKAYVGYETSGSIKVSIKTDDGEFIPYILTPTKIDQKQHRDILTLTRNQKGTYWTFKIENIDGCDFSLDHIEGLPIILTKGRR